MRYAPFFLTMAQVIPVLLLAIVLEFQRLVVPLPEPPKDAPWWRKRLDELKVLPVIAVMATGMACEIESVRLGYLLSLPDASGMEAPTPEVQRANDWITFLMIAALFAVVALALMSSEQFKRYLRDKTNQNPPIESVQAILPSAPEIEPTTGNGSAGLIAGAVVGALITLSVASMARKFKPFRRS